MVTHSSGRYTGRGPVAIPAALQDPSQDHQQADDRQDGRRDRVVYNLTPAGDAPEPPPRPPERCWERSTAKKLREPGETLGARAERAQRGEPRAAA